MVEPLGQPIDHGRLEGVVMQNGRIDESRELRLAPRALFRLAADARPYRIDGIEGRLGLLLRHRIVSRSTAKRRLLSYWGGLAPKPRAAKSWANGPKSGPMADKLGHWPG